MSRNQPSSASVRYKISNPQPFVLPESIPRGDGPYPIFPTTSIPSNAPPRPSPRSPHRNGNGESRTTAPAPEGASPVRPARSRMRDQPPAPVPARDPRRNLAPPNTQPPPKSQSRPQLAIPPVGYGASGDQIASPLSPIGSAADHGGGADENEPSDPFAADRDQRLRLRAQANAAAQPPQMQYPAGSNGGASQQHTLRNVVGAFMAAGKGREEPSAKRPPKSRARQEVNERDELWRVSEGGRFGQIDNVLVKIRTDWPFILESDFSSSSLALSLLSQTHSKSLPAHPPLSSFLKIHDALSAALQASVQGHFQSFAASLPAHATFLATLSRAQQQIRTSKSALKEARDGFAGKGKAELASVRTRQRQVKEMLRILDTLDELKQTPDRLDGLIGDKQFLQAALLLVKSVKTINKPEITEIGAVSDLRTYFKSQEGTLTDILVEELHNHLYLKSFTSEAAWRSYTPGQTKLHATGLPLSDPLVDPLNTNANQVANSRLSRYLSSFVTKPEQTSADHIDLTSTEIAPKGTLSKSTSSASLNVDVGAAEEPHNREADSFRYIETLLESLGVLGKLGYALDLVTQRVAGEINALVETTLDEVEERSEQNNVEDPITTLAITSDINPRSLFNPTDAGQASLAAVASPRNAAILQDLLWTLYSKLAAVLEGHRVVYEVSRWISARRDFKDNTSSKGTFNIPVLEIWKPIQDEVRNLLTSYLRDEAQGSALDRRPAMSVNEVLREGKVTRDRQKPMFRFVDTDTRAVNKDLKIVDETIQETLKVSVPGLVNVQAGEGSVVDDNFAANGRHRTLIPANPFNVTTLFQPTVAFIERSSEIVPEGFEEEPKAFGSVLEDFVVKVFLPQLDERVTASFQNAVSGYDAYQIDRRFVAEADKPPLKSSVRVMTLIHGLCYMLQTTPFHRENYSRLVIGVIVQYYQQCSARFKELVAYTPSAASLTDAEIALPASWAQRDDVTICLGDVRAVSPSDHNEISLAGQKEIRLEMELLNDKPVLEPQLINSARKIEALCHLSQSLRWFIDALLDVQDVAEEVATSDGASDQAIYYTLQPNIGDPARLPLTRAMAQRFGAIIQTFEQLAEMVLNTLRLEARCRVMCNLTASFKKGNFNLESEALEPDTDIANLAHHLIEYERLTEQALSPTDKTFVVRGLGQLADHMFIQSAKLITIINDTGVQKIRRNILSIQQTLRAIQGVDEGVLGRSIKYWDLYKRGPKNMLETLRKEKPMFTFEDYNTMLNLQCKTDQADAPSSELNTYLIDLHALSMSIEGWEIGEG